MTLQPLYLALTEELQRHRCTMELQHTLIGTKYFHIDADLEGLRSQLHCTLIKKTTIHMLMEHAAGTKVTAAMSSADVGSFMIELQQLKATMPQQIQQRCSIEVNPVFQQQSLQSLTMLVRHRHTFKLPLEQAQVLDLVELFYASAVAALQFAESKDL